MTTLLMPHRENTLQRDPEMEVDFTDNVYNGAMGQLDVLYDETIEHLSRRVDENAQISFQYFSTVLQNFLDQAARIFHTMWRGRKVSDVNANEKLKRDYEEKAKWMVNTIWGIGIATFLGGAGSLGSLGNMSENWKKALETLGQFAPKGGDILSQYFLSRQTKVDGDISIGSNKLQEKANAGNQSKETLSAVERKKDETEQKEAEEARSIII